MQNAVLRFFPNAQVVIRFTNRSPHMLFSKDSFDWIHSHVDRELQGSHHGVTSPHS